MKKIAQRILMQFVTVSSVTEGAMWPSFAYRVLLIWLLFLGFGASAYCEPENRSLVVTVVDQKSRRPLPGARVCCVITLEARKHVKIPTMVDTSAEGKAIFTPWLPAPHSTRWADEAQCYIVVMAPGYYSSIKGIENSIAKIEVELLPDASLAHPLPKESQTRMCPLPSMSNCKLLGSFKSEGSKVITMDPLYEKKTAVEFKHVIDKAATGTWYVHTSAVGRTKDGEGGQLLVHYQNGPMSDAEKIDDLGKLNWEIRQARLGSDSGIVGFFDEAHFADDTVVDSQFVSPKDFEGLSRWYSYICHQLGTKDYAIIPNGCVIHTDGAVVVEGRDQAGKLLAVLFLYGPGVNADE